MKQLTFFLSVFSLLVFNANAAVRYVSVNGSGSLNGSSWANAYPGSSLQTAINNSNSGDEVWVAQGIYYPTTGTNRSISFSMKNGVAVYGSFNGTETSLTQRNLTLGLITILSGEIGSGTSDDNSYDVIHNTGLDNSAVIDGFIISGGNDDRIQGLEEGLGGGIYNDGSGIGGNCSPTIRNCDISRNQAVFGAGIFNNGYNGGNASPQLINCIISGNEAYSGGGGIDNFGLLNGNASPTFLNCVVYDNTAGQSAGGMYCWAGNNGNTNPVLINTTFVYNNAPNGGGIVSDRSNSGGGGSSGISNPTFRNCIIWGNSATNAGPQFLILGGASFSATYTDIDLTGQTSPNVLSGATTGNIQANPLFVSLMQPAGADNVWMSADDGLRILSNSPCVDVGDNSGVTATDLIGGIRVQNSTVDMGAYEYTESTASLPENKQPLDLIVSPNPTGGFVKLICNQEEGSPVRVSIIDLHGKMLFSSAILNPGKESDELEIDLRSFESGIYLLNVETTTGKSTQRIVKK